MAVNTQDATVAVRGLFEGGRSGKLWSGGLLYPSVEDGAQTVGLTPIEENFGSMDAIARLVKNTKAVA